MGSYPPVLLAAVEGARGPASAIGIPVGRVERLRRSAGHLIDAEQNGKVGGAENERLSSSGEHVQEYASRGVALIAAGSIAAPHRASWGNRNSTVRTKLRSRFPGKVN